MNKKADVEIMGKSFVAIVLGILGLVFLFYFAFYVFDALFASNWACTDTENDFNLLTQYIENYNEGKLTGEKVLEGFEINSRCLIVGFDKDKASSSNALVNSEVGVTSNIEIDRPRQCKGDSCLCLCERGEIHQDSDWNNVCLSKNKCKTFKDLNEIKGSNGNLILFPSLTGLLNSEPFNLYVNKINNNICLDKTAGVCTNG